MTERPEYLKEKKRETERKGRYRMREEIVRIEERERGEMKMREKLP